MKIKQLTAAQLERIVGQEDNPEMKEIMILELDEDSRVTIF